LGACTRATVTSSTVRQTKTLRSPESSVAPLPDVYLGVVHHGRPVETLRTLEVVHHVVDDSVGEGQVSVVSDLDPRPVRRWSHLHAASLAGLCTDRLTGHLRLGRRPMAGGRGLAPVPWVGNARGGLSLCYSSGRPRGYHRLAHAQGSALLFPLEGLGAAPMVGEAARPGQGEPL
jgi:hypothetical protein